MVEKILQPLVGVEMLHLYGRMADIVAVENYLVVLVVHSLWLTTVVPPPGSTLC